MTRKEAVQKAIRELNRALSHQAIAVLTLQEHRVLMHDEVERARMETARARNLLESMAELMPDEARPLGTVRLADEVEAASLGVVGKELRQ